MNDFSKIVNLVWRVPVAILLGGFGYYLVKYIVVWMLSESAIYMSALEVVTWATFVPLMVPIGFLVWAFGDFIFPPKPPEEPPRGGFMQ
jgi:hypothetical protein